MRGLKQDRSARVVIAGHGFVQDLRRGHDELAVGGAGGPADGGRVRRARLGDLILDWGYGVSLPCPDQTQQSRSPRSGSPWPAAAPEREAPAPRLDGHAASGRSSGVGPSRGAIAAAWSAAPATRAGQGGAAAAPAQPAPRGQPSPIGVGPPSGGAPQPRAATPAAPRPWSLSAAPAAPAIPAPDRRSDRAVVAPSTDHLRQRVPRRSHSSEATTDLLAPTPWCRPGEMPRGQVRWDGRARRLRGQAPPQAAPLSRRGWPHTVIALDRGHGTSSARYSTDPAISQRIPFEPRERQHGATSTRAGVH
jgi:hypothetical protein